MWPFEGRRDPRRLHWSVIENGRLKWIMKSLFHAEDAPGLPPSVWLLHDDGA